MRTRSRDRRKTVRYWAELALKKLGDRWDVTEFKLLENLKPYLEKPDYFYRLTSVCEVVWSIVSKFSPVQLGTIGCQGIGDRRDGKERVIEMPLGAVTGTRLYEFKKVPHFCKLHNDGKTILREVARMTIVAKMYDILHERMANMGECHEAIVDEGLDCLKKKELIANHSRVKQYCNCGAGEGAHPADHSASCPAYETYYS